MCGRLYQPTKAYLFTQGSNSVNNQPTPPQPNLDDDNKHRAQGRRRTFIGYGLTGVLVLWLLVQFFLAPRLRQTNEIPYSEFKQKLAAGQIVTALIGDSSLTGTMKN